MVSKLGRGNQARLICCDCGFDCSRPKPQSQRGWRRSQLITVGLILLFGLTAGGLMLLNELENPSLLDEDSINLREPRINKDKSHRWRSVVPRSSSLQD